MVDPNENDPSVEDPSLARLVALARAQVAPPVSVTFESVRAQADKRRYVRWATQAAVVLVAAAALLWVVRGRDAAQVAPAQSVARTTPASASTSAGAGSVEREPGGAPSVTTADIVVSLAGGGSVHGPAGSIVHTPDDDALVELKSGSFVVETGTVAAELLVYERVLEVAANSVVAVDVSVKTQRFEVRSGKAQWRSDPAEPGAEPGDPARPSAEALVRRAEAQMKAANRTAATRTLTTLVRRYPRSGAAKAAMLDLARLRKAAGQKAHARCAYALFLERWPKAANAEAVRRARDRLPNHGKCRGLEPDAG